MHRLKRGAPIEVIVDLKRPNAGKARVVTVASERPVGDVVFTEDDLAAVASVDHLAHVLNDIRLDVDVAESVGVLGAVLRRRAPQRNAIRVVRAADKRTRLKIVWIRFSYC